MFEVDKNFSWQIRKKRAKQKLTKGETAEKIGISRKTLTAIESGTTKRIKRIVYEKIVNWLMIDDE